MALQHVQAEQHVHRLIFEHGETRDQEHIFDFNLGNVNSANDFLNTDSFCYTRPSVMWNIFQIVILCITDCENFQLPGVNQTHDIASFCARWTHDSCLCARIDERFHWHAIYATIYV